MRKLAARGAETLWNHAPNPAAFIGPDDSNSMAKIHKNMRICPNE
jgi:hypothetical protein